MTPGPSGQVNPLSFLNIAMKSVCGVAVQDKDVSYFISFLFSDAEPESQTTTPVRRAGRLTAWPPRLEIKASTSEEAAGVAQTSRETNHC